jgi:hypothetical protein
MPDDPDDIARRARADLRRQTWTGRFVSREDDLPPVGATIQERLELLAELSERAWALTGQPIPQYTREQMPGRLVRPGDPR